MPMRGRRTSNRLGRSRDDRYGWIRDATFTRLALISCGYIREAAAWREWLLWALGRPEQMQMAWVGVDRAVTGPPVAGRGCSVADAVISARPPGKDPAPATGMHAVGSPSFTHHAPPRQRHPRTQLDGDRGG